MRDAGEYRQQEQPQSALDGEAPEAAGLERVREGLSHVHLFEPGLASELSENVSFPRHRVTAAWLQGTLLLPAEAAEAGGVKPWGEPQEGRLHLEEQALAVGGDLSWCPVEEARAILGDPGCQAALAVMRARGEGAWAFDAWALSEATCGRPLSVLGLLLLREHGLMRSEGEGMAEGAGKGGGLALNPAACWAGLSAVEMEYKANPYHCKEHAADVLWSVHCLLTQGGVLESGISDPLEVLAVLLAAAIHDVGHPGLNNAFLVATEHPLGESEHVEQPAGLASCPPLWALPA